MLAKVGKHGFGPYGASGLGLGEVAVSWTEAQMVAVADETHEAPQLPERTVDPALRSHVIKTGAKFAAEVSASEMMPLGRLRAILGAPDWKKRREAVGVRVQGVLVDGPLAARSVSAWDDDEPVRVETVAETSSVDLSRFGVLIVRDAGASHFFALTMGLGDTEHEGETEESTRRFEESAERRAAAKAAKEEAEAAERREKIAADLALAKASGDYDRASSLLVEAQALLAKAESYIEEFRVGESGPGNAERQLEDAARYLKDAGAIIQGGPARSDAELYRLTKYVHERLTKLTLQLADEKRAKRPARPAPPPSAPLGVRDVSVQSVGRHRSKGQTVTEFVVQTRQEPVRHVRVFGYGPAPSTRKHNALVRGLGLLNAAQGIAPEAPRDPYVPRTIQTRERTGRYAQNLSGVCVCGHVEHTAAPPHECIAGDFHPEAAGCTCERFRKSRSKKPAAPPPDPLAEQYGAAMAAKLRERSEAKAERRRGWAERYGEAMADRLAGRDEPVDPEEASSFDAALRELEK